MRTYEREHEKTIGDITILYGARYSEDERVEECHGFHTFYDTEVVSVWINSVVLNIEDLKIDITDRLTKKEKDQIADYLYE